jgi:hypothetical protein
MDDDISISCCRNYCRPVNGPSRRYSWRSQATSIDADGTGTGCNFSNHVQLEDADLGLRSDPQMRSGVDIPTLLNAQCAGNATQSIVPLEVQEPPCNGFDAGDIGLLQVLM